MTVNKGWLYGLITLQVLSLSYNQVDYIEDDGWDFCKQLYDLNLQVKQKHFKKLSNILIMYVRVTNLRSLREISSEDCQV